jgi:class 3 adenylate cyclase
MDRLRVHVLRGLQPLDLDQRHADTIEVMIGAMTLPAGTVTFLFTDVEGSTRLLRELGERYANVVADHRRLLREAFSRFGGREIDTQGDAFFFAFSRAKDAVGAAIAGQDALRGHAWPERAEVKVRMGLHTGEPTVGEEGYLGLDVVRAARICSAGHGGQILLSETTRALLGNDLPDGAHIRDLGEQHLKDIQHERVFQLTVEGEPSEFPPLKTARPSPGSPTDRVEQRADELAAAAEAAIEQHVLDQIERALKSPGAVAGMGLRSTVVGLLELVLLVVAIVVIVLLIRLAF